jgi:hypothetical protein
MDTTRITVRFTDAEKHIHASLVRSAKNNRRSLNAEMLRAFEFYLKNSPEAQTQGKEVGPKKSS